VSGLLETLLYCIISALSFFTLILFTASVTRRYFRLRMFTELDKSREFYRERIEKSLHSGTLTAKKEQLRYPSGSPKWKAIEEILLGHLEEPQYYEVISSLLKSLGYISHYERMTRGKDRIQKAYAIDMLGKMRSEGSTDLLLSLLIKDEGEIVTVTTRALSKIGSKRALKAILSRMPDLLKDRHITRKALVTSLVQFADTGINILLDFYRESPHPWIKALVLDSLSHMRNVETLPAAIEGLKDPHSEVRAKALKLVSVLGETISFDPTHIYPLLIDSSWFVRLHAARALGNLRIEESAHLLRGMLMDSSWQVRNAAASSLSHLGHRGVEAFREIMGRDDNYAKETVCEELGKTGMVQRLIEDLGSEESERFRAAREIIGTMCSLNFKTQCEAYASQGENVKVREELARLMEGGK